jgi:hypothetical protein
MLMMIIMKSNTSMMMTLVIIDEVLKTLVNHYRQQTLFINKFILKEEKRKERIYVVKKFGY